MGQNMDSFIYLLVMYKGPVNKNCYFPADQTMFCFLYKGPVNKNCYFPADNVLFFVLLSSSGSYVFCSVLVFHMHLLGIGTS